MARIILAGTSSAAREKLSGLLSSAGHSVFRCCASESELRRALDACEDAVVILAGLLPGARPEELLWDWGEKIQILLIAKPAVLQNCESEEIFRLAAPTSGQAVIGALEMLLQLHRMRLPKRNGADRDAVERAKSILMKQYRISETEAHRFLQQYAMNHGIKMAEYASRIVDSSRETEE